VISQTGASTAEEMGGGLQVRPRQSRISRIASGGFIAQDRKYNTLAQTKGMGVHVLILCYHPLLKIHLLLSI
jgi:hypothetical protein